MDIGCSEDAGESGLGRDEDEGGDPEHPMFAAEGHRATHPNVQEGQTRDDEEARLTERHGEPKPHSASGVIDDGVASRATEEFIHSLPCEDNECEQVASSEPQVTLVCWRD